MEIRKLFLSIDEYNQTLYSEQSQMKLKGFRKGKVPLVLVQQIKTHEYILNSSIQTKLWIETLTMMQNGKSVKDVKRNKIEFIQDKGWNIEFQMNIEDFKETKNNK